MKRRGRASRHDIAGYRPRARSLSAVDRLPAAEVREPHFYVVAAQVMRRILVDHARRRNATKRVGALPPDSGVIVHPDVDVLALDNALSSLAAADPEKASIVQLRYFAGLSIQEVAEITGASPATVKRQWTVAKAWLFRALNGEAVG